MADDESTEVELHGGWWQMMGAQKLNFMEDGGIESLQILTLLDLFGTMTTPASHSVGFCTMKSLPFSPIFWDAEGE